MKKYQVTEIAGNFNHAGSKATQDVAAIAKRLGYCSLEVRMNTTKESALAKVQRQIGYRKDWKHCLDSVEDGAVVLLQHPFHYPQLTRERTLMELKEKKHVRFISFVHDVEKLRAFRYNDYYKREFDFMMRIADVWIVHNQRMKQYFEELGTPASKLVDLEVFDYLQPEKGKRRPEFAGTITIAGNLDTAKCGYIGQLGELKNVNIHLYGMNYDKRMDRYENISYGGSLPAEEIPEKLTAGFGLVWDGESIDGCVGEAGQYVRYNNPHKLSLYLSSGLPVVICSEAAEAAFVRDHGFGICVSSLRELDGIFAGMTPEEYGKYVDAVNAVSGKLKEGYFAETAIRKAEKVLEE